ncbi:conserved hypothetical protein [Talaromyces marneffei ATCC 18224]|uniref:Uncharacterized protein n=1 Tax=Talaromyces marneffei (strain ATCC 18224 / CBS 334.59 / QM 7333) TaxID=441960 RepID=B6QIZ2_TALMQ|nr:conserved hypothetical protein [Talaromyces marneffei ATCC 18224]
MTKASVSRDAGIAYLDEEISQDYEGDGTCELATIFKRLLSENGGLDALICGLGRILRYDDCRQDALVQMLLELHKLPPRQVKIWDNDYSVYKDDPIFGSLVDEDWNRYSVHDSILEENSTMSFSDVQERCDDYLNYSAFLARCTGAGLYKNGKTIQGINTVRMESLKDLRRICHTGTYGNPGY